MGHTRDDTTDTSDTTAGHGTAGQTTPAEAIDERIAHFSAAQHGVVTRAQLLSAGLTPRMVQSRLRSRRLRPLHRGVYLPGHLRGALEPMLAREMAAVLACGPGAVVSHRSAAWLWEIMARPADALSSVVDVTVPHLVRRQRPGIEVRRSGDLTAGETTMFDGIPVTTPGRTLRDLSTVVGRRELNRAAARAERRGFIADDELTSLISRHRGRRGAPLLRAAMAEDGGPTFTRSEAEERFLDLVRSGGLPLPETNIVVRDYEVDFFWRAERIAVEVDGFEFHASRRSFENDRRRDTDLAAHGIHVIRITWRQLVDEPGTILVSLARALAMATAGASRPARRGGERARPGSAAG